MGAKEKRYTWLAVWVELSAALAAIIWRNYNSLPKLGFEVNELLGVVAITTFLLGFKQCNKTKLLRLQLQK